MNKKRQIYKFLKYKLIFLLVEFIEFINVFIVLYDHTYLFNMFIIYIFYHGILLSIHGRSIFNILFKNSFRLWLNQSISNLSLKQIYYSKNIYNYISEKSYKNNYI